jgi:hypothetical protein
MRGWTLRVEMYRVEVEYVVIENVNAPREDALAVNLRMLER